MSETEEKPGIFARAKSVFWQTSADAESPSEDAAASETGATVEPEPQADLPADLSGSGASDFAAAYAQIAGAGDPKTDQVLAAFTDMSSKGLEGQALATAMTAMISAFGADAKAIAATIAERRQAIASAIASQRAAMQGRIAEMRARTEAVVEAAENEIGELEERIKNLRGQVAMAQETVQKADAGEQASFASFERQATQKNEGLNAFAEFLTGVTTAS